MPQPATASLAFPAVGPIPIPCDVDFLGGRLTSVGGLSWLAEADDALGLTATLAAKILDWRTRRGQHELPTLIALRVYQIACGYLEQRHSAALRPAAQASLQQVPRHRSGPDQPTLSRLENAIGARTCY